MALLNDGFLIERKGLGALIALFASVGFCSKYKEISPLGRSWLVQTRASEYTGVNVQAKTMSQDWVGSGEKVVVGGKPPEPCKSVVSSLSRIHTYRRQSFITHGEQVRQHKHGRTSGESGNIATNTQLYRLYIGCVDG